MNNTPNEILYEMISKFKQLDRVDQGRAIEHFFEILTSNGGDWLSENEVNLKLLESITGTEVFKQILEAFPGERLYIPGRGEFTSKQERNNAIRRDFYNGADVDALAEKYKLSATSVYRIINDRG